MLSKIQKIARIAFPKFTEKKVVWSGDFLRFSCYKKNNTNTPPRFTVVVSKKQYKKIVARNLFKRRVFSLLQKHYSIFSTFQFDRFVISPKSPVEKITFPSIKKDFEKLIAEYLK